jgi:NAD+ kinase
MAVMKRIGILYHPMRDVARSLARQIEEFLVSRGISVWSCSAWEGEAARQQVDGTDLLLSIGGDGTILRTAQAAIQERVPVTGVNVGKLGFMTELGIDEVMTELPELLDGKGWIDERSLLEAEFLPSDSEQERPAVFHALNDVVVARGEVARVVYVEAGIDGEKLTTYKGDGVIVASATGSTGYALAAGGPILHPNAQEMLLLPIVPHVSATYTLVLPSTVNIELTVGTTHPAMLSIDGHINRQLSDGARVTVRQGSIKVPFLRIHPVSHFYGSLDKKLQGKK